MTKTDHHTRDVISPSRTLYISYLFLGMGTLFPWNAYITAIDYYIVRYPHLHVDRFITIAYLPINLIVIALFVHYHHTTLSNKRIIVGFLSFTFAMLLMPLLDLLASQASSISLAVTLTFVFICGAADGMAQGALFGEAAAIHPRCTQALVAGTAISGVVVSMLRLATKAILPQTMVGLRLSADIYFLLAAIVCGSCVVIHIKKRNLLRSIKSNNTDIVVVDGNDDTLPHRVVSENILSENRAMLKDYTTNEQWRQWPNVPHESPNRNSNRDDNSSFFIEHMDCSSNTHGASSSYWLVLYNSRFYVLSLILIYTVTLSIFPGVLAEDIALSSSTDSSWYPIVLIAVFNAADCAGKCLPVMPLCRIINENVLVSGSLARLLFIPAFYIASTTLSNVL